jgi:hypothetical protein
MVWPAVAVVDNVRTADVHVLKYLTDGKDGSFPFLCIHAWKPKNLIAYFS